ncbi:MAG: TIGR03546 family protein [Candidatus Omnitrophota bacterium]
MIPFINLPVKIVKLFTSNVSPSEVAAGVCLGLFIGFVPMNGPITLFLFICLFLFKVNRLASMLALPVFKLFYVFGVSYLADWLGGILLIKTEFLTAFWNFIVSLPIIAYLDLNNTLVTGGLTISLILCYPVYIGSQKGIILLREKYFDKVKDSKFIKWFKKLPLIGKLADLVLKVVNPE